VTKEQIVTAVSQVLGRPVRWAPRDKCLHECRDRILAVYETPAKEQLAMLRKLRSFRQEMDEAAGGIVVVMFFAGKMPPG